MRAASAVRFAGLALLGSVLGACATPTCGLPGRPAHHGATGFCNEPGAPEPTASLPARIENAVRITFAREREPVPDGFVLPEDEALAGMLVPSSEDRITWLGHATTLLQIEGKRVLIDPVWSTYATPMPPLGPRRATPPAVPLAALPPIDVLIVTHDHYDHLDMPTLRALPGKDRVQVVVPLGLAPLLRSAGFADVVEMDWWEERRVAGLSVRALPAAHTSARGAFSRNRTLWASFAIAGAKPNAVSVYVSGDSGHHSHFERIGRAHGPFDLAVIYLGGYAPRPVARARHVTPSEMVRAGDELRAATSVPVHWGTFPLGAEPTFKPGPAFLARAREAGWPLGRAMVMRIGETRAIRDGGAGL